MTETESESAKPQDNEIRMAQGAYSGLRQDLFDSVLDYRPLQPMRLDGRFTRRLPERIREFAGWAPHASIIAVALMMFTVSIDGGGAGVLGLLSVFPLLLTLVRPVLAWWAALGVSLVTNVLSNHDWPWTPTSFVGYLLVITVVALRTTPRTAAWMWALTAAYAAFSEVFFDRGYSYGGSTSAMMLFTSALVLLAVSMFQVRRKADEEVAAQQSVTAVERGRRTLLEERTTIARELHDVVAHHMSVVAIQAEAAPYRVENPPPELEQAFLTIRENAVAALTELRRILGVVRADDYEAPDAPQPTLAELDGLIDNVRDAGLTVEKTITGAVRELPQGVELSAYRIVQEALSNALRHAPGSTARVEVAYVLGGLGLRIVNTPPRGLVKPSPGAGHGVTGMRERVTMLNGEMTADLTEDGGYEVAAFIPVAAVRDGDAS
ncbi:MULTISPECIES: sensor histidine kinase [unclassified Streptomyces]|uniref:sensor histidine kinase n=2 Tax=unclassified Streptomyces TaxID=2593676 RepID=UPI003812AC07